MASLAPDRASGCERINAVKNYSTEQINSALHILITDKSQYMIDILGRQGRLVNIDNFYMFQPIELENKHLTEFTKHNLSSNNSSSECVVGVHHTKNLLYMHTSYFLWLKNVFGFEETPDIIHFIAYKHAPYLKTPIERYLKKRFEIKKQMLRNADVSLNIQSEILKLIMNR